MRLRLAFLGLGLAAIGLTGFQSYQIAHRALQEASYERLTGIRETKKRQIETYFRDTARILATLARDESVADAYLGFQAAWLQLETQASRGENREVLAAAYGNRVVSRFPGQPDPPAFNDLLPASVAGTVLQARYWLNSTPEPAARGDDYAAVHRLHHPSLADFADAFDFEDLLLIDPTSETVLYSVRKGHDLGIALAQVGYASSSLREAARRSLAAGAGTVIVDFAPYAGSFGSPALFAAHAVVAPSGEQGVLAARLSTRKLDDVMTGGGSWLREGLGESGETYLVGPDLLMRSDSRFQLETPDAYYRQLREIGYPPSSLERLRSSGTSVLIQAVDTAAARQALAGRAATQQVADYRGIQVLSSYTPLALPGLDWAMLSEIDVEEVFRPVRALRLQLAALALLISGAFALVGYLIARRTTRPLLALTAEVERLGRGGLIQAKSARAFRAADDEIARLWQTFEDLTERLSATLVSRDHLDSLLASMINAVFVLGNVGGGARGNPLVTSANPAACRLLGYSAEELRDLPLRAIVGSASDEPPWIARLRGDGSLPAIEKELVAADGRRIPVLFTAALVDDSGSAGREAVCVAQDITERKAAEERLQASRQELRVLAGRLLNAQEDERSRLARELHDDVTQRLAMLAIDAGKLARGAKLDENDRNALATLKELIVVLSHDVQGLSRRLHPAMLDDLGLPAAMRAECRSLSKRLGIPVSFASENLPVEFPRESSLVLYRIAQESFRNIAAHSGATEVSVELGVVDGNVRLSIEDDGRGFDREEARRRGGLGLASLGERARLVGGRIEIRTSPGAGVRILVEIPRTNST